MARFLYVSHGHPGPGSTRTDLDAVASLALLWRGAILKGLLRRTDYEVAVIDYYAHGLDQLLPWRDVTVVLADIPPEALAKPDRPDQVEKLERTLKRLAEQNVRLNLIDHHAISPDTARRFLGYVDSGLLESALLSFMDHETDQVMPHEEKRCGAEMVLEFVERRFGIAPDEVMKTIARYAHDQDFGIRVIPEASRLSVVVGADFPPLDLAETLAVGELWNGTLARAHDRQVERTRRGIESLKLSWRTWRLPSGRTIPVVYALMPEEALLKVSPAGMHCLDVLKARVAVLVQRRAFISLRIPLEESELHAGTIVSSLGGGGHQGAASAGGRNGPFPYGTADESNFEDVVGALDRALVRAARCDSV